MDQGPRIYNLFPLLCGPMSEWKNHLPRISAMQFNWIYVNPFHYPGFSGSLYAVKDYYALHPLFQGQDDRPPEQLLRAFLHDAHQHGIAVIMDLVINHTAKDSPLVYEHPGWYSRNQDGSVRSPSAIDPADARNITVWGDLAEIEYHHSSDLIGLINYWQHLVKYYSEIGFDGFRCDAAYKVPSHVWHDFINAAHGVRGDIRFFAETLGARLEEVQGLQTAGFDYFFNSAKWWDFKQAWLLDQYNQFRHVAPSIAFPESHDTERLAKETNGWEGWSKLEYLFAAFFSSGVMIPIGYEFGFKGKLDVVNTRPEHWEQPAFDISAYIAAVNNMKARISTLNQEGPQYAVHFHDSSLVGLLRLNNNGWERAFGVINSESWQQRLHIDNIARTLEIPRERLQEITPMKHPINPHHDDYVYFDPTEMRIFI